MLIVNFVINMKHLLIKHKANVLVLYIYIYIVLYN